MELAHADSVMDTLKEKTGETKQGTPRAGGAMLDKVTEKDEVPSPDSVNSVQNTKDTPSQVTIQRMSSIRGNEYDQMVGKYIVKNDELRGVFGRAYTMNKRISTGRSIAALPESLLMPTCRLDTSAPRILAFRSSVRQTTTARTNLLTPMRTSRTSSV